MASNLILKVDQLRGLHGRQHDADGDPSDAGSARIGYATGSMQEIALAPEIKRPVEWHTVTFVKVVFSRKMNN